MVNKIFFMVDKEDTSYVIDEREPGPGNGICILDGLFSILCNLYTGDAGHYEVYDKAMEKIIRLLDWVEKQQRKGWPIGVWQKKGFDVETNQVLWDPALTFPNSGESIGVLDFLIVFSNDGNARNEMNGFLRRLEPLLGAYEV